MRTWMIAALVGACTVGLSLAKETAPLKITGSCKCGEVKYEAAGPIVKSSYCDCLGCRKATGALKAPFITVKPGGFKVVEGSVTTFKAKGGKQCDAHGAWNFCGTCGTHVYWMPNNKKQVDIFAGTLDDTKLFQPKKK